MTGTMREWASRRIWRECLARQHQEHTMNKMISRFAKDQSGATAIEYGLIASLISVAIIGAITTIGTKLTSTFGTVSSNLK